MSETFEKRIRQCKDDEFLLQEAKIIVRILGSEEGQALEEQIELTEKLLLVYKRAAAIQSQ